MKLRRICILALAALTALVVAAPSTARTKTQSRPGFIDLTLREANQVARQVVPQEVSGGVLHSQSPCHKSGGGVAYQCPYTVEDHYPANPEGTSWECVVVFFYLQMQKRNMFTNKHISSEQRHVRIGNKWRWLAAHAVTEERPPVRC